MEEGLVDREPVPQHQGQRRLSLSEKGRALAELYLRELQQAVKTEFESMESADQYPLLGALQLTETEGVETVQDGHIRVLPSKDADFAWFLNEMSKIKLRKGQVGLFSEAVSIVNQNLQDTYAAELRLTAQRRLKPVGMCLLLSHPNRTDLELAALYVDPVHRQLGAATAMVERAISNAARLTYLKIYAATGENESDMRKLLERCGFRKERGSRRIMRYGQPETVYRFIKDLPMA